MTGKDPRSLAEDYGVIATNQGDFSRGISSSVDSMQAGLYGLTAWAAGSKPKEGGILQKVQKFGMDGYNANMGEVQLRSKRTDNVENNETFGDWVDSTQYWLGYAIPQIAEVIIGSKGAGALTRKVLERNIDTAITKKYGKNLNPNAKKAVMNSKVVQDQLNKIPGAVKTGEYAAIGTQAIGTELGHTYGGAVDEAIAQGGTIDDVDYGRATKFGLAAGAAEFAGDVLTLGIAKLGPAKDLLKSGKLTSNSRLVNAAVRTPLAAGLEGTTEVIQTGLEEMGAGHEYDIDLFKDPTSFFAGAVGGGAMGLAGGLATKKADPIEALNEAAEEAQDGAEETAEQNRREEEANQAQLDIEEFEASQKEELRDVHSKTFPSQKTWLETQNEEKELLQRAQLLDSKSELSIQFKAWRKENQIYLSNDQESNDKVIKKFLKSITGTPQNQEIRDAHVVALDAHAALQEAKETRSPEDQSAVDIVIEGLAEKRRVAIET